MAHKFNREVEIRSALLHLHSVIDHEADKEEAARAQQVVDVLAAGLGQVYGADFSDLEKGDSYGEIEYLRWAVDGCQTLLGFDSDDEMEESIKIDDSEEDSAETPSVVVEGEVSDKPVFYRSKDGTDWQRCGVKSFLVGDYWWEGRREARIYGVDCVLASEEEVIEEIKRMEVLVPNFPHIQKDIDRIWKVINER